MENVYMQGFRNWGPAPTLPSPLGGGWGWGVQAKRGQIPRNEAYIGVRRSDEG